MWCVRQIFCFHSLLDVFQYLVQKKGDSKETTNKKNRRRKRLRSFLRNVVLILLLTTDINTDR